MHSAPISITPDRISVLLPSGQARVISSSVFHSKLMLPNTAIGVSAGLTGVIVEDEPLDVGDVGTMRLGSDAVRRYEGVSTLIEMGLDYLRGIGIDPTSSSQVALSCSGVGFHHDLAENPDKVFCVVWLGSLDSLDLVFPFLGLRIPLSYGTVVLFDSGQPHAVLARGANAYSADDYNDHYFETCISIDLPAAEPSVVRAMSLAFYEPRSAPGALLDPKSEGPGVNTGTGSWHIKRADCTLTHS